MREVEGNIFEHWRKGATLIVPTNGVVIHGNLVMGAGIAKRVKEEAPDLPALLGEHVSENGNVPYYSKRHRIISFPTKHHWQSPSPLALIRHSALALNSLLLDLEAQYLLPRSIVSPRLGCGLGNLRWAEVAPSLGPIFSRWGIVIVKAPAMVRY